MSNPDTATDARPAMPYSGGAESDAAWAEEATRRLVEVTQAFETSPDFAYLNEVRVMYQRLPAIVPVIADPVGVGLTDARWGFKDNPLTGMSVEVIEVPADAALRDGAHAMYALGGASKSGDDITDEERERLVRVLRAAGRPATREARIARLQRAIRHEVAHALYTTRDRSLLRFAHKEHGISPRVFNLFEDCRIEQQDRTDVGRPFGHMDLPHPTVTIGQVWEAALAGRYITSPTALLSLLRLCEGDPAREADVAVRLYRGPHYNAGGRAVASDENNPTGRTCYYRGRAYLVSDMVRVFAANARRAPTTEHLWPYLLQWVEVFGPDHSEQEEEDTRQIAHVLGVGAAPHPVYGDTEGHAEGAAGDGKGASGDGDKDDDDGQPGGKGFSEKERKDLDARFRRATTINLGDPPPVVKAKKKAKAVPHRTFRNTRFVEHVRAMDAVSGELSAIPDRELADRLGEVSARGYTKAAAGLDRFGSGSYIPDLRPTRDILRLIRRMVGTYDAVRARTTVTGSRVHVPGAMTGEPASFRRPVLRTGRRTVTVIMDMSGSMSSAFVCNGAAFLTALGQLHREGVLDVTVWLSGNGEYARIPGEDMTPGLAIQLQATGSHENITETLNAAKADLLRSDTSIIYTDGDLTDGRVPVEAWRGRGVNLIGACSITNDMSPEFTAPAPDNAAMQDYIKSKRNVLRRNFHTCLVQSTPLRLHRAITEYVLRTHLAVR